MIKSQNIVIVGGGSAGWITAAYLIRTFPQKNITVIESPDIPTVGVGESTLADITDFRDYLEIDEKEFMQFTNASYKMSIKFTDFYKKDSGGFHYPFRVPYLDNTIEGIKDWFYVKAVYPETDINDFVRSYFPHAALFEKNKITDNKFGFYENFSKQSDVAYHFDSVLFGKWLKDRYCIPRGVELIKDTVIDYKLTEQGIEKLFLKSNREVNGDLFIDCTGFKSLLLEQYMKEPFESFENVLPNNRAWAVQIPYKNKSIELEPFTNCTAIENGWCWNIPLWSRLGCGYVYSDKFVDKEKALDEFKKYLKSEKMIVPRTDQELDSLDFKDIPIKTGIHTRTWVKNVVAIGLSACFIEPLESNGLFSVFWFVEKLAKSILHDEINQWDIDAYNTATRGIFLNFVEFVALHYALSRRDDTNYWQHQTSKTFSPGMVKTEPTITVGFFDLQNKKMFDIDPSPTAGITYIATGMNYLLHDPIDVSIIDVRKDVKSHADEIKRRFDLKKKKWEMHSANEITVYEYLKKNIYFENE